VFCIELPLRELFYPDLIIRVLIDVKNPSDPKVRKHGGVRACVFRVAWASLLLVNSQNHILTHIIPQLPTPLHVPIHTMLPKECRCMPNSFLPPVKQGGLHSKKGIVIVLGDEWNVRHLLTGSGMTVALYNVVLLTPIIIATLLER
jgi:hypothetical protein